jgi:hypothetical protein
MDWISELGRMFNCFLSVTGTTLQELVNKAMMMQAVMSLSFIVKGWYGSA